MLWIRFSGAAGNSSGVAARDFGNLGLLLPRGQSWHSHILPSKQIDSSHTSLFELVFCDSKIQQAQWGSNSYTSLDFALSLLILRLFSPLRCSSGFSVLGSGLFASITKLSITVLCIGPLYRTKNSVSEPYLGGTVQYLQKNPSIWQAFGTPFVRLGWTKETTKTKKKEKVLVTAQY